MPVESSGFLGHVFQNLLPNRLGRVRRLQHTIERFSGDPGPLLNEHAVRIRGVQNAEKIDPFRSVVFASKGFPRFKVSELP
jgi:hypothetical protein